MTIFDKTGITSTEANHYANIAKELVDSAENKLKRISIRSVEIVKDQERYPLKNKNFDGVLNLLEMRPAMFKLNAWLRHAIKAKDKMIELEKSKKYHPLFSFNEPQPNYEEVDQDWAISQLSIKELAEYLSNEAEAAGYGYYIHEDARLSRDGLRGILKKWQDELNTEQTEIFPDHIRTCTESVSEEDINKIFFDLQKKHREHEKKVNYYKAKIHSIVNDENTRRAEEYKKAVANYREKQAEHNARVEKERAEFEKEKIKRVSELSNLRIRIPHELERVLSTVREYAE